ncbi:MAG: EAL domain-containing protein [Gammaproteobacteria bacterium]|nr:EAL domain-containing protein [Gammaproteobacteria bacterium]MBU2183374.1 EAL domain-containing protein [Gammaproteobacteria bacterium]MBU2204531.1 EAL domain-containing protein [Gammaproteobacteria bacterium]
MKDVIFNRPTKIDSLGRKFALVVFLAIVFAGMAVGYLVIWQQQDIVFAQQQQFLRQQATHNAKVLSDTFLHKEQKAIAANQIVMRALARQELQAALRLPVNPDNSVRMQDDYSAAFVNAQRYNKRTAALFERTGVLWQQLSPLLLQDFFNFYFISTEHFIRIAPGDWAMQVDSQHDFSADIFYQLATPEQNPARQPRWTPVYYDSIWQKWMTSLIIPLYINDKFVGVTGSDYVLSDILDTLPELADNNYQSKMFLFDATGTVLKPQAAAAGQPLAMNTRFQGVSLNQPELEQYIRQVTAATDNRKPDSRRLDSLLVASAAVERLDWQVGVYTDNSNIMASLVSFRYKLVLSFVAVAVLIALLLQLVVYHLILKRLNRLSAAIPRLSRGDLEPALLDNNADEIGRLNQAFGRMSGEISELVAGLNARIEEKEQAERSARKLSKAVSFSSSGIVLTDAQLNIEYTNPFLIEMMGSSAAQLQQQPLHNLFAQEMFHVAEVIEQTLTERQHWRGDMLLQHQDRQLWVSLAIAPIRDDKGDITNYVCAMQDISFIKQSQKKMEQLAYYDVLTGLANRSYFRDQLRKAIAMSHRGYYSFALLYFDLDEFKRINDTLGHDAGDELLKEVSRRLISRLREEDTIARLGGDEFAVILSGINDRAQASNIAANLQQAFAAPVKLGHHEVSISASIGITVAPEDAAEEELLLKHADLAMYEAKARGKNTFHFFSPDLNEAANERLLIENQLREAIRDHQFLLYYQPKIDLRDNSIVGYETLLRWLRPDNTLIPPLRFIGVAESTGLIVQIGEWIIWEACRFLSRQQARGHNVTVSINLSVRQFRDDNLPEIVERILQRTGANPANIIFEITESMLMGDTDAAISQLNQLKRLGVALSIDDFGTGYSSLSYLKRFPVDELKIDRSFVKDIPDDRNDMDIVAAIIAMAQKMNLRVVAEGVETAEQVEFLKNNACYQVQGYYFSVPLAEQELSRLSYNINS